MTYTATYRFVGCTLLIACLLGLELAITKTITFARSPLHLSIGILFDCTVLTTAIFYGLVARPLRLPISRTVLFSVVMLRVALFIVPAVPPALAAVWPVLFVLLEGFVLVITAFRLRTIVGTYRTLRPTHGAYAALQGRFSVVFGQKAAHIILSEGQVLYHALFNWHGPVEIITLREPVVFRGIYGLSRTVTEISLFIDDLNKFTVFP